MQNAPRKRRGVKMWQKGEGDRWVLKGGIIHSRERIEKTNHSRWEIDYVKVKPPHKKRKEECSNKISYPVEEGKNTKKVIKIVGCIQKDLAVQERKNDKKIELDYIYRLKV